jgi:hypothetical protein
LPEGARPPMMNKDVELVLQGVVSVGSTCRMLTALPWGFKAMQVTRISHVGGVRPRTRVRYLHTEGLGIEPCQEQALLISSKISLSAGKMYKETACHATNMACSHGDKSAAPSCCSHMPLWSRIKDKDELQTLVTPYWSSIGQKGLCMPYLLLKSLSLLGGKRSQPSDGT